MRTRRWHKSIVALVAFGLIGAACGGGGGSGTSDTLLDAVMKSGTLRVATDPKYPPQSSLDTKSGKWEGFDIDVATEIAKRMGLKVEFKTPAWESITAGNWQDRWDLSVGSMTITPDRAKVLDFSPPYYYTPAGLAVNASNTSIKTPADLTGKTVGSCGGCTYEQYLEGTLKIPNYPIDFQVKGAQIKTYDTDTTAIADLSLGDCDRLCAVFSAIPTLQGAIDSGSPIKLLGQPLYYEPLGVAVDKEASLDPTSLTAKVASIVAAMHQDGTLSQLSKKWYGGQDLTVQTGG
jgi:polar amino acid transport system substrate-binding protein